MGFIIGLIVGSAFLLLFFWPDQERFHVSGPMNVGHEALGCQDCHKQAEGTTRQQIQANVRYYLGWRKTGVDFGHQAVSNAECLACHERPNDRHPVFRFFEPRFFEARQTMQPHLCSSCHLEHSGKRITAEPTFCVNCHEGLKVKNDPLTISHEALIAAQNWESCLGCHDFHGNHLMKTETNVQAAIELERILEYFDGAPSPYSEKKAYQAKKEGSNE